MLKPITCATLGELANGEAEKIIDRCLERAVFDLDDRGEEDKKPRIVTITVTMGVVNGMKLAKVDAVFKPVPYASNATECVVMKKKDGMPTLMFQNLNAERADQPTFKELDEVGAGEDGEVPND